MSEIMQLLLVVGLSIAITMVGTRIALRADGRDRSDDNVMTAAIRLVGAAFVFLATFTAYSQWQSTMDLEEAIRAEVVASGVVFDLAPAGSEGELIKSRLLDYVDAVAVSPLSASAGRSELSDVLTSIAQTDDGVRGRQLGEAIVALVSAREVRDVLPETGVPWVARLAVGILGVVTLGVAAVYPRGHSRRLKLLQAWSATAVVTTIVATLVLLQAPWIEEARLSGVVTSVADDLKMSR